MAFNDNNNNGNNNHNIWSVPGIRFCPTDTELVVHYLMTKINNEPLPSEDIIKEVQLYHFEDPYELIGGESENKWYFFTKRDKKYPKSSQPSRTTGKGVWKASGGDKSVLHKGQIVGQRKSFVFHYKTPGNEKVLMKATTWQMQEFRVETSKKSECSMKFDDNWVLCKVYELKRKKESQIIGNAVNSEAGEKLMNEVHNENKVVVSKVGSVCLMGSSSNATSQKQLDNNSEALFSVPVPVPVPPPVPFQAVPYLEDPFFSNASTINYSSLLNDEFPHESGVMAPVYGSTHLMGSSTDATFQGQLGNNNGAVPFPLQAVPCQGDWPIASTAPINNSSVPYDDDSFSFKNLLERESELKDSAQHQSDDSPIDAASGSNKGNGPFA